MNYEQIPHHWINRLGFVIRRDLAALFRASGHPISAEEWAVLLVLWQHGPQSPSVLAQITIKDRTTITRLLDAMVRKSLVQRDEDPKDRRRSVVRLTSRGAELKGDLVPVARGLIDQSMAGIPPEDIAVTLRTLQAMTHNLVPHTSDLERDQLPPKEGSK